MIRITFRFRVVFWICLIVVELILFLAAFLHYQLGGYLYQNLDRYIHQKLEEYSTLFFKGESLQEIEYFFENEVKGHRDDFDVFIVLFSGSGHRLYRSSNLKPFKEAEPLGSPKLTDVALGQFRLLWLKEEQKEQMVRVITIPVRGKLGETKQTYLLQVAFALNPLYNILNQHRSSIISAILLILFFTITLGYLVTSKLIEPILQIIQQANLISAQNLTHQRLLLRGTGDEMDRLIEVLNKMLDRIERSLKKIQQFTTNAAHELRTPLTTIRGEIEFLLLFPEKLEEKRLRSALEELDRLILLCKRLLFLSRLDEGQGHSKKDVALNELLQKIVEQMYPLADSQEIELIYEEKVSSLISGNESLLFQVFLNLLDNAIKYSVKGGKIRILLAEENSFAKISIQDQGRGIASEHLPHLFERFYRVQDSSLPSGSGLGLAIVKEVVEFHGGRIEVLSEIQKGTTFHLFFPKSTELPPIS